MAVLGLHGTYSGGVLALALVWAVSGGRGGGAAGVAAVLSLIGLCQYADPMVWGLVPTPVYPGRIFGSMGSPVFLGAALAVLTPWVIRGPWALRLVWLAALLGTQTRGALLAVVAVVVYLAPRRVQVLAVLVGALAAAVMMSRPGVLESDSARVVVYKAAVRAAVARPLTGWGPENTMLALEAHGGPAWGRYYKTTTQDHAHNSVLEAVVAYGVPGALIFVWFCVSLWRDTAVGSPGRGALLAMAAVSMFNPVPLSVKVLAVYLSAADRMLEGSVVLSRGLITVSLAGAVFASFMVLTATDMGLPSDIRVLACRMVSIFIPG